MTHTRPGGAFVLSGLLLAAALWLFVLEVTLDEGRQYAGSPQEAGGTSCGSAYDVVLLKGNGFMGGEVPANQRLIDSLCVAEAGRAVAAGSALAGAGVVTGLLAGIVLVRGRRRPEVEAEQHHPAAAS